MKKLFKKGISSVLALSMAASMSFVIPFTAHAEEPTYAWDETTKTLTITGSTDSPIALATKGWNDSRTGTLDGHWDDMEKLVIGAGISSTGEYQFATAPRLAEADLSGASDLKTIGNGSFEQTQMLTDIKLPSGLETIGNYAFKNDTSLKKIVLPDGFKSIGSYAFNNAGIESINLPEGMTDIGDRAFLLSKVKEIVWPASVKEIKPETLNQMLHLESVTIPEGVETIGPGAMWGDKSLTSLTLPSTITRIANHSLAHTGLTSFNWPESVKDVEMNTFDSCTSLTQIQLPDTVEHIYQYAFANTGLTSFAWPASATYVENNIFTGSKNLTQLTIPNTVTGIKWQAFQGLPITSFDWPSSVTVLPGGVFRDCTNLTEINLPDTVTGIDEAAFFNTGFTSFDWPDNIKVINKDMFSGCTKLAEINLPNDITNIASGAFYNTALTSFNWPSAVATIPASVFQNSKLAEITIPNTVTTVEQYAFASTPIKNITLPDSVTAIGLNAFQYSGLESFKWPSGTTEAKNGVLEGTSSLKSVELSDKLTNISDYMFKNSGITSLTIPKSVTTIGNYAFEGSALTTLDVPANVTTISPAAFVGTNFTSFTWPSQITEITALDDGNGNKTGTFQNSGKLKSINIPSTVTNMAPETFNGCGALTKIIVDDANAKYVDNEEHNIVYEKETGKICFFAPGERTFTITKDMKAGDDMSVPFGDENLSFTIEEGNTDFKVENGMLLSMDGKILYAVCDKTAEEVTIPEGVETIYDYAFYGSAIKEITIPNTVKIIGERAFNSPSLTALEIPSSVEELGNFMVAGCGNLESLTFAENSKVTELPYGSLIGTAKLKSIEIPASVETIGGSVFQRAGFTKLTIPGTVKTIGQNALSCMYQLEELDIQDGVEKIESNFWQIPKLRKLIIPDSVTDCATLSTINGLDSLETLKLSKNAPNARLLLPCAAETIDMGAAKLNGRYANLDSCTNLKTIVLAPDENMSQDAIKLPESCTTVVGPSNVVSALDTSNTPNLTTISTAVDAPATVDAETGKLNVPAGSNVTQGETTVKTSQDVAVPSDKQIEVATTGEDENASTTITLPTGTTVKSEGGKEVELPGNVTLPEGDNGKPAQIPVTEEGTATLPAGTTITTDNGTKITPAEDKQITLTTTTGEDGKPTTTTTLPEGTKIEKENAVITTATTDDGNSTSTMDSNGDTTLAPGSTITTEGKDGTKSTIAATEGSKVSANGEMEIAGGSTITTTTPDGKITEAKVPEGENAEPATIDAYGEAVLPKDTVVTTYANEAAKNAGTAEKTETLEAPATTNVGGDVPELSEDEPIVVGADFGNGVAKNDANVVKPVDGQEVQVKENIAVDTIDAYKAAMTEGGEEAAQKITTALTNAGVDDSTIKAIYDLKFSNEKLHTNDKVTVKLATSMTAEEAKGLDVYHILDDGTAVQMHARYTVGRGDAGTYWEFETSSFSPFVVAEGNITNEIYVGFERADEYVANTNVVYNVYAKAYNTDENTINGDKNTYNKVINRLMSANLIFSKSGNDVAYEFTPADKLMLDYNSGNRYAISYDGVKDNDSNTDNNDGDNQMGYTSVLLGQVKFTGMGAFNFTLADSSNVIYTSELNDNIVTNYVGGGTVEDSSSEAKRILKWGDDVNTEKGHDPNVFYGTIDDEIKQITRDVDVKINFNNNITAANNKAEYNKMTVNLKGGLAHDLTVDLGVDKISTDEAPNKIYLKNPGYSNEDPDNTQKYLTVTGAKTNNEAEAAYATVKAFEDGTATVTFHGVPAAYNYTVTVAGKGYRTAKYNTMIPADSETPYQLDFWNNVKDNAAPVEVGGNAEVKTRSSMTKNFLAGDIDDNKFINIYDLSDVVSYFAAGETSTLYNHLSEDDEQKDYVQYDLNRDGRIDSKDVAYVLVSWGN